MLRTSLILSILAMAGATMIQHAHLAADPLRSAGAVQNGMGTLVAVVTALAQGASYHTTASAPLADWSNRAYR